MSDELEKSLRAALRPLDPGEEFTRSVLARVADEAAPHPRYFGFSSRAAFRRVSVTLAVVLAVGLFCAHQYQAHRTREGLEARRQLLVALQVTGENLDTAYRMINQP